MAVTYLIQEHRVTMPVRIRDAAVASAMFAVPATAAQALIAYSGLEVVSPVASRAICSLAIRPGVPLPSGAGNPKIDAYSCLDGVTRRTPWTMTPHAVRMRPGGARIRLGDHPVAQELRELGLDGAHALSSSTVGHLTMEF